MNGIQFVKRIDELLHSKKETRAEFLRQLELPRNSITNWNNRGNFPAADIAVRIAKYLRTTVEWLVTGENRETPALTDSEREVIENMRDMDERGVAEMVEISRIKRASVAEKPSESAVG